MKLIRMFLLSFGAALACLVSHSGYGQPTCQPPQTYLQTACNLSDLANATTAAANLFKAPLSSLNLESLQLGASLQLSGDGSAGPANSFLFGSGTKLSGYCSSVSCSEFYFAPTSSIVNVQPPATGGAVTKLFDIEASLSSATSKGVTSAWSGSQSALSATLHVNDPPLGILPTIIVCAAGTGFAANSGFCPSGIGSTDLVVIPASGNVAASNVSLASDGPNLPTGTLTINATSQVVGQFVVKQLLYGSNLGLGQGVTLSVKGTPSGSTVQVTVSSGSVPTVSSTPIIGINNAAITINPGQSIAISPAAFSATLPAPAGTYVAASTGAGLPVAGEVHVSVSQALGSLTFPYTATFIGSIPSADSGNPHSTVCSPAPCLALYEGQPSVYFFAANTVAVSGIAYPMLADQSVLSVGQQSAYGFGVSGTTTYAIPTNTAVGAVVADASNPGYWYAMLYSAQTIAGWPTTPVAAQVAFGPPLTYLSAGASVADCNQSIGGIGGDYAGEMTINYPYNYQGSCFAQLLQAYATAGTGAVQAVVGQEIDLQLGDTLGALNRYGVRVVLSSNDVAQGVREDAAFAVSGAVSPGFPMAENIVPGLRYGLAVGGFASNWPIASNGTIIAAIPDQSGKTALNGMQAQTGLDFSLVNFSNAAIQAPNFSVRPNGDVWSGPVSISTQVTTANNVTTVASTIAPSIWTVTGCSTVTAGHNYQVNDVVYAVTTSLDNMPVQPTLLAACVWNGSSFTTVPPPPSPSGTSSLFVATQLNTQPTLDQTGNSAHGLQTVGGNGRNATVMLTWTQASSLTVDAPTLVLGSTGTVQIGQSSQQTGSASWAAAGSTPASLSATLPAGASNTAVTYWLTVKDAWGNVRYIPAF